MPGLPYAHLNLRWNPFGERPLAEWAELAVVALHTAQQHLRRPRAVVQLTGDKGYGKTTHLMALKADFPQAGYVHIPEGETRPVPQGQPIMIDEAQRLTWWQRRQLFRGDDVLVLGTHRDFESQLVRCGRPVMTLAVGSLMTSARLCDLLNRRIEAARRGPGAIPEVSAETAAKLLNQHGPNVRRIVGELYEQVQQLPGVEPLRS